MQNDKLVEALEQIANSGRHSHPILNVFQMIDIADKALATLSRSDDGAGEAVQAAHTYLDERDAPRSWDVGDGQLLPMSLTERIASLISHPPAAVAGEGLVGAVQRFLADYDDGDRAEAGNNPLMEAHVADFRALSQPAADAAHPPADALREAPWRERGWVPSYITDKVFPGKPLAWRKPTDHPQDGFGEPDVVAVADGFGGRYSIREDSCGVFLWWAHDEFTFDACADVTEAKQKAERDWQDRLRAALSEAPSAGEGSAKTADADGGEA